ncbi:MAG: protein-glutamate O-methyltransferase CheR [Cellvibrionaceae bacterium]
MNQINTHKKEKAGEYEGFDEFSEFLKSATGIALSANKHYLVAARIKGVLEKYNIDNLVNLVAKLKDRTNSSLRIDVIDAMTTNETYWFRDEYPFHFFKNTILPDLHNVSLKNTLGRGPIRIWSGACSSGQEAYSLSMVYEEYLEDLIACPELNIVPRSASIIGTDVSQTMIAAAKLGVYDRLSISRGLNDKRRNKFFLEQENGAWQLKQSVRSRVSFNALNFIDSFNMAGKFDVVFCRNVLIYFSSDLKNKILMRLHESLHKGGYLCLGSSEGLAESSDLFDVIHCNPGIIYRAR